MVHYVHGDAANQQPETVVVFICKKSLDVIFEIIKANASTSVLTTCISAVCYLLG